MIEGESALVALLVIAGVSGIAGLCCVLMGRKLASLRCLALGVAAYLAIVINWVVGG